jgi:hypothetical protein
MANFYPPFYDQIVFDQTGNLAVGGTVEVFYTNTSNPAPIYDDDGAAIPNPINIGRLHTES